MDHIWEARDNREKDRKLTYSDMDDGEGAFYFCTGIPPQRFLDQMETKETTESLYKRFLKRLKRESKNG